MPDQSDTCPGVIEPQSITVPAKDGHSLSATYYQSADRKQPAGVILFNSATAVPQRFYAACARFFTSHGYDAYTYDYRGIGQSAPATLRGFDCTIETWGRQDIAGMIDFIVDRHPDQSITYVGHSVGGQLLGMADNANQMDRAVFVSCQSNYWKLQDGFQKQLVWINTRLVLPILSRSIGYFPWSKLVTGEDLPKGVAIQWAKWCRHPNYLFGDPELGDLSGYKNFRKPILAYCISDDDWGTRKSVESLTVNYSSAKVRYRDVSPKEFGFESLGHFGYFKRERESIWKNTLQWIQDS